MSSKRVLSLFFLIVILYSSHIGSEEIDLLKRNLSEKNEKILKQDKELNLLKKKIVYLEMDMKSQIGVIAKNLQQEKNSSLNLVKKIIDAKERADSIEKKYLSLQQAYTDKDNEVIYLQKATKLEKETISGEIVKLDEKLKQEVVKRQKIGEEFNKEKLNNRSTWEQLLSVIDEKDDLQEQLRDFVSNNNEQIEQLQTQNDILENELASFRTNMESYIQFLKNKAEVCVNDSKKYEQRAFEDGKKIDQLQFAIEEKEKQLDMFLSKTNDLIVGLDNEKKKRSDIENSLFKLQDYIGISEQENDGLKKDLEEKDREVEELISNKKHSEDKLKEEKDLNHEKALLKESLKSKEVENASLKDKLECEEENICVLKEQLDNVSTEKKEIEKKLNQFSKNLEIEGDLTQELKAIENLNITFLETKEKYEQTIDQLEETLKIKDVENTALNEKLDCEEENICILKEQLDTVAKEKEGVEYKLSKQNEILHKSLQTEQSTNKQAAKQIDIVVNELQKTNKEKDQLKTSHERICLDFECELKEKTDELPKLEAKFEKAEQEISHLKEANKNLENK